MPRRDYSSNYNNSSYGYGDSYSSAGSGGNRSRTGTSGYDYDYSGYYQDTSGGSYGGMSGFGAMGGGFANFDKIQEQLSLRESQLAMASNLLEQQSRLIADVSSMDRDRRGDRRNFRNDRKRSGSDYRKNDNKRRRNDSGSYGDDRRDNRRGYGDKNRAQRAFGGGRQGNRQGGDRGRGPMSPRNRDNRRSGGGRGGGGNMNRMRRNQGRNSQGDKRAQKQKIIPRVSKELSRHYCHICEVECFNERNYQNHLTGTRHKEKEVELEDNPTRKAEVQERMKKQEEERAKPLPVKESVDHCDICDLDIHVTLASHLKFKQHRHRETQVKRGCAWCNVGGFSNFSEVLAHRLTEQHKEMREQFGGRIRADTIPKPEYIEEEEIPAFQEDTPLGRDYVVQVTGFFCKLCNKFYKKEEAAKKNHCSSESHYDKWKQAKMDAIAEYKVKLTEQKEREEAAQKRIEEQAKKRAEEEAARKENGEEGGAEERMETDVDVGEKAEGESAAMEGVSEEEKARAEEENQDEEKQMEAAYGDGEAATEPEVTPAEEDQLLGTTEEDETEGGNKGGANEGMGENEVAVDENEVGVGENENEVGVGENEGEGEKAGVENEGDEWIGEAEIEANTQTRRTARRGRTRGRGRGTVKK